MAAGSRRAGRQRLCSREPLISASRYSDQCSRLLSSAAVLGAAASRAWLEPAPTGTWPTSPSSPRSRGSSTWRRSTPCALALALRTALARTPATTPVPRNDPARVRRPQPRQIPSSASPAPPQVLRGAPPRAHSSVRELVNGAQRRPGGDGLVRPGRPDDWTPRRTRSGGVADR